MLYNKYGQIRAWVWIALIVFVVSLWIIGGQMDSSCTCSGCASF